MAARPTLDFRRHAVAASLALEVELAGLAEGRIECVSGGEGGR